MEIDRKKIKKYFIGKSQLLPLLLVALGIVLLGMEMAIGAFVLVGGIGWWIYNKFSADLSGQSEVDKATDYEMKLAKERAMKKLNLVDEQVQEVDPVVVFGRGFEPDYTSKVLASRSFLKRLFNRTYLMYKSDAPIYMIRIGADDVLRCSLASYTIFMFGEKQLYIYYSNVDLCTGLVYSEGTHEYFYSDINAISFQQDVEKIFNFRKRKYQRILFEAVKIYASGVHHTATLSTTLDKSVIDREFTGMRNLIRDRKNAE